MNVRSNLIAIEGIDGCGKSIQTDLLVQWLISKDIKVRKTAQSGGTAIGSLIRRLTFDTDKHEGETLGPLATQLLFMADRVHHQEEVIIPALNAGHIVVSDRYIQSGFAYGQAHGLTENQCKSMFEACTFVKPAVTIWLDLPVQLALSRVRVQQSFEKLGRPFYVKLREHYWNLFIDDHSMERIEITEHDDVVSVQDQIRDIVKEYLRI
jgi:dTMP kinase